VLNFEENLLKDLTNKATARFKKLNEKYNNEAVKVSWEVEFGQPSKTLLEVVKSQSLDLIVMGSHGASGLREYFIGSNAEKVIRKSPVPVLIAKDYFKGPISNIVFPNTLETQNQGELVAKVKALQAFFNAQLHVVWINTPINFVSDVITRQRLEIFAKRFALKDYSLHIYNHPNEEDGIIHFTEFIKGDIIAMGTHGRRGFTHLINGSVAEDVANHTESMIWTYTMNAETVEG
jgi:nucleotide-binding universal stress UspA family protein